MRDGPTAACHALLAVGAPRVSHQLSRLAPRRLDAPTTADDARAINVVAARCHTNILKLRRARTGLGARDAGISPRRRHNELVVGGEVLRPRRARDGEDRLQINSRRAAAALIIREEEAQEGPAQGLGAELVHRFCGSRLLLALGHQIGVVGRRGCVGRARDGVGRPGNQRWQQCGRAGDARAAYGRRSQSDTSFLQQRPRVPRADGDFGRADPSEEPLPTRARLAAAARSALAVRVAAAAAARRLRSCARAEASVCNPRVSL